MKENIILEKLNIASEKTSGINKPQERKEQIDRLENLVLFGHKMIEDIHNLSSVSTSEIRGRLFATSREYNIPVFLLRKQKKH